MIPPRMLAGWVPPAAPAPRNERVVRVDDLRLSPAEQSWAAAAAQAYVDDLVDRGWVARTFDVARGPTLAVTYAEIKVWAVTEAIRRRGTP